MRQLEAALELVSSGDIKGAQRMLRAMRPNGEGSLSKIVNHLILAHHTFGRQLPRQVVETNHARQLLAKVERHASQRRVSVSDFARSIELIREMLTEATYEESLRIRPLLCNLRMLSDDRATDHERVVESAEGLQPPVRLFTPAGIFTRAARKDRVNGSIISQLTVDTEGCVARVEIVKGMPHGLNESTTDAFRWYSYEPATLDGQPVSAYNTVTTTYSTR